MCTELLLAGVQPQNLGVLLTLFQPEGADYAHHITDSTPGFENLTTSLLNDKKLVEVDKPHSV